MGKLHIFCKFFQICFYIFFFIFFFSSALSTLLCAMLVLAWLSINCRFLTMLFFSFFIKSILVLYTDRGLVRNGQTNLVLFNQLYWLVVLSIYAFILGFAYGSNIWRGEFFFKDMSKARACLLGQMPEFPSEKKPTRKAICTVLVILPICWLVLAK